MDHRIGILSTEYGTRYYATLQDGTHFQSDDVDAVLRALDNTLSYMNIFTGSVGCRDSFWYETAEGALVNAVDRDEVILVRWNKQTDYWEEV
jgi:hypothetical protein